MLAFATVPASLLAVLENASVFTTPSFAAFAALVVGLVPREDHRRYHSCSWLCSAMWTSCDE